ncbi:MAG: 23S rRNA (adenine(2503)-C(2))-methyltransferase RlmN [Planctomycetota bacterium]
MSRFLDLPVEQLRSAVAEWVSAQEQPTYRADQVCQHLLERRLADPARMANLPAALRQALADGPLAAPLAVDQEQISGDGTRKYTFKLADGALIESVWIPSGDRNTLCISSQAGCPAACTFCATGAGGFKRNLSSAEIITQWLYVDDQVRRLDGSGITQIVFMGMGEPLFNYEAVERTLGLLTDAEGFAFSPRRITVSTVGVPRRMEELAAAFPQLRLALSLHSARNETRDEIVPMNLRFDLGELRRCLQAVANKARRVTLEYVVLHGVNDSDDEADALARFAAATAGHINLLPFHPFPGAPYPAAEATRIEAFKDRVARKYTGRITIRRSRGLDIAGACGQLAAQKRP